MRVLITGGCGGYIGTLLTPYLIRKGYNVRCVDRLFFGDDVLRHVIGERNFELIKADTRSISKDVLNGVDAVVDLAALSNDPAGELNPQWTLDINYRARARLLSLPVRLVSLGMCLRQAVVFMAGRVVLLMRIPSRTH